MKPARRAQGSLALAALLSAGTLGGCGGFWRWPWGDTQRWPGPMEAIADPLPTGDKDVYREGPEDVLVLRHADPCQVRPAGYASSFPLSFYKKQLHVHSGSAVYTAPGGRLEVLWPDGTSIVLHGRGAGIIGSKSRGEPTFLFQQVERAQIDLKQQDQVELVGGSQLSAKGGPFLLEQLRPDVLRLKNQSKGACDVSYRDSVFRLDPGEIVDLPLSTAGGAPKTGDVGWIESKGPGFPVGWQGAVEVLDEPGTVALRATGEQEIRALGVRVRLGRDEEVRFHGLGKLVLAPPTTPLSPPAPAPAPAPASTAPASTPPAAPPTDPTPPK